jgi:tripeptidyl-peptidase-2
MTNVVTATSDVITGLSGRSLKLSNLMKSNNASNEYRLGLKTLSDLYPSRVRDKIVADAKQKQWDEKNKKLLADVARDIAEFDGKNPSMHYTFYTL